MSKYIDSEKLIANLERQNVDKKVIEPVIRIVTALQQEQPEVDFYEKEHVGVAESPSKTFPRVNDFECGGSYRH